MATSGASAGRSQYLTRSEVARLFEVSPATVSRWTREGRLPCVRTLGGQRRYRRELIEGLASGLGASGRREEGGST